LRTAGGSHVLAVSCCRHRCCWIVLDRRCRIAFCVVVIPLVTPPERSGRRAKQAEN
jgi:hypothetical protein